MVHTYDVLKDIPIFGHTMEGGRYLGVGGQNNIGFIERRTIGHTLKVSQYNIGFI